MKEQKNEFKVKRIATNINVKTHILCAFDLRFSTAQIRTHQCLIRIRTAEHHEIFLEKILNNILYGISVIVFYIQIDIKTKRFY